MATVATVGESEFRVLILEDGNGEFWGRRSLRLRREERGIGFCKVL